MSVDLSSHLEHVSGFDLCDLLESSGVLQENSGFVRALSAISRRCQAEPSLRQDLGKD